MHRTTKTSSEAQKLRTADAKNCTTEFSGGVYYTFVVFKVMTHLRNGHSSGGRLKTVHIADISAFRLYDRREQEYRSIVPHTVLKQGDCIFICSDKDIEAVQVDRVAVHQIQQIPKALFHGHLPAFATAEEAHTSFCRPQDISGHMNTRSRDSSRLAVCIQFHCYHARSNREHALHNRTEFASNIAIAAEQALRKRQGSGAHNPRPNKQHRPGVHVIRSGFEGFRRERDDKKGADQMATHRLHEGNNDSNSRWRLLARRQTLSTQESRMVQEALQPQGHPAPTDTAGPTNEAMATLLPGVWLNDEVVDAWMKLLHNRSPRDALALGSGFYRMMLRELNHNAPFQNANVGQTNATKSHEITITDSDSDYDGDRYEDHGPEHTTSKKRKRDSNQPDTRIETANLRRRHQKERDLLRKWVKVAANGLTLQSITKIVFPINKDDNHWVLGTIHTRERIVTIRDSFNNHNRDLSELTALCASHIFGGAAADWKSQFIRTPTQTNKTDCGVFMCLAADFVMEGDRLEFDASHIPHARERIAARILQDAMEWNEHANCHPGDVNDMEDFIVSDDEDFNSEEVAQNIAPEIRRLSHFGREFEDKDAGSTCGADSEDTLEEQEDRSDEESETEHDRGFLDNSKIDTEWTVYARSFTEDAGGS